MVYILGSVVTCSLLWVLFNLFKKQVQVSKRPSRLKYYVPTALALFMGFCMLFIRGGTLTIAIICMGFSFVGMIYCARRQKVYAYAQPVAISLLMLILVCMVLILTKTMGSEDYSFLIENEIKYARAGAYVMGQELAQKYPDRVALVITDKNWKKSRRSTEIIDALKDGIAGKISIKAIDYPTVPVTQLPEGTDPNMPEDFMMFEEMVQAENFNDLIKKYPECNLLIFTVPLPHDMVNLSIWDQDPRPMVALLNSEVMSLKRAIKAGLITALCYKPDLKYDPEDNPPRDYQKAFEKRYMIISKDNVDEIAEKYKEFFQDFNQ